MVKTIGETILWYSLYTSISMSMPNSINEIRMYSHYHHIKNVVTVYTNQCSTTNIKNDNYYTASPCLVRLCLYQPCLHAWLVLAHKLIQQWLHVMDQCGCAGSDLQIGPIGFRPIVYIYPYLKKNLDTIYYLETMHVYFGWWICLILFLNKVHVQKSLGRWHWECNVNILL